MLWVDLAVLPCCLLEPCLLNFQPVAPVNSSELLANLKGFRVDQIDCKLPLLSVEGGDLLEYPMIKLNEFDEDFAPRLWL